MNNDIYRRAFLLDNKRVIDDPRLHLVEYAKYVVDYQIINRNNKFANDRTALYGFSPIAPICYVSNSGDVVVKMFEMNSINHYLVQKQGNVAVEVAMCILAALYKEVKSSISSFDATTIDKTLSRIEKEYKPLEVKTEDKMKDEEGQK